MAAQTKTYTIAQATGNEVEVMPLAQLQALVKSRLNAGEDPQTVVGFVGLEYEGAMYFGITSELNGTASALEDGLDIRFWWEDEYNETGFKWLWEVPEAEDEPKLKKIRELTAEDKRRLQASADRFCKRHGIKSRIAPSSADYLSPGMEVEVEIALSGRFELLPLWQRCFCRAVKMPSRQNLTITGNHLAIICK